MSFKATIEADIKGFSSNIDKAISDVDRLEKSTLQKLSNIGNSFVSIGKKASILSVAVAAAGAKAFSMAADFEDALGATDQVFKESSEAIKDWANNLGSQYGVAKKEALEYANLMGTMLINIGQLTEDQASKQSQALVELAGDLTAMFGGSTQEAVNALTSSLRGNNIALTRYGVAVNEAMIKAKALELGLISGTSEMTLQAKQAATLALIWEQTGAAQGQAAREADGASGAMRAFRTEVANLSTELGEVLLPIITPIISKLTDIVGSLRALSPEMQSMIVSVAGVTAVAGPLLIVIGNILKALPLIKAALVALTGPVGLVVGAIVAGTALIIANWDELKTASKNVVDAIISDWDFMADHFKTVSASIGKVIRGDFAGWWADVKKTFDTNIDYLKTKWQQLKGIFKDDLKINIDQAALEAALAANEMTGLAGAMQTVKKEATDTEEEVDKLTSSMKELAKVNVPESIVGVRIVIDKQNKETIFDQLFSEKDGDMVLKPIIEPTIEPKVLKDKMLESVKSAMGDLSDGIQVLTIDLSNMLVSSLTDIFGAVSEAIASGGNVIEALGSALLGTMGSIMVQLGQQVVATGSAIEAVKLALTSLGGLGAIAAGVALIAIGSMFKAGANKIGNSMGSGGYSSAPSLRNTGPGYAPSEYRGAYQDDFVVTFKIGNDELIGTLDTAEQRRRRL